MSIEEIQKLPIGWSWTKLEDLVDPYNGYWGQDESFVGSTKMSVLGVGNITNEGYIQIEGATERHFSMRDMEAVASEGDLLVVKSSGSASNIRSGKTGICPQHLSGKIACSNFMIRLVPRRSVVEPSLLWHVLNSHSAKGFIKKIVGASTYPNIKWSTYKEFIFPLPPLPKQKRIAAILTEKMAAVEKARAAAEERLQAAKELPAAYLREVFQSVDVQRCLKKRLGDVLRLRNDIIHPYDKPKGNATFVGLEHLQSGTGIRSGSLSVEMETLTGRKPKFYTGDIVYGYLRPYLNKVWIAEFNGLCSVDQYVYSVDLAWAVTRYIAWYMRSPLYLQRAPIDTSPGQLPRIRKDEVSSIVIELPSIQEQTRIADQIDNKMSVNATLTEIIDAELDGINKLPTALLRQAFS